MRADRTGNENKLTLTAQIRKGDDPAQATTSRLAEPVEDTDRVTLSCAARHASNPGGRARARRRSSRVRTPSQTPNVAHVCWLTVSPRATDTPVPMIRAETNGHSRARSPWLPLFPQTTDPGATGTRSRPTPPSPASASNARPRNPPVPPRTAGTFGAPPASTVDATAPPTANAAAAPPEDGLYTRPPLSIVDAAATSTAGAAAAPAKVGPTWRQGPRLHPEPESAPLPPSPPLLPPARRTARSDNARNPPPAADCRFHRLHPCLRVEMARTPRPRGPRARPYTEASCIYRCARTSGRPGGDLNRPFPWTRAPQRGKRWPSAWWPCRRQNQCC